MSCMSPGSVEPAATADSFRCSTKVARADLTLVSSEASASAPRPYSLSCLLAVASFTSSAMIFFSCAGVNFMDICLSPAAGSSICIMESYERSGICLRPGGGLEVVGGCEVAREVGG